MVCYLTDMKSLVPPTANAFELSPMPNHLELAVQPCRNFLDPIQFPVKPPRPVANPARRGVH